jgi:glycosyltransferase involved in cell wall biosynthesis
MACGTPVVSSGRASLAEITTEDVAVVVDPPTPDGFGQAIIRVLEDPSLALRLGRRGAARARTFRWESTIDATVAVYDRILRRRR